MGKNTTDLCSQCSIPQVSVEIVNAGKADVLLKRRKQPLRLDIQAIQAVLKLPTVGHVIEKKGASELFRKAVYGMLPTKQIALKNDEES
jgi:ribosomal protein L13